MAIYHLNAQIISRKAGRSSTAAAAYRAGVEIVDERTGEIHDYRRKAGVEHAEIVMPLSASDWAPTRAELWNAAELKNKRADAQVAREFVVALPAELSPAERQRLAVDFAREIADRYSIAADVAIHAPSRDGDDRNHHAHILTTTNRVEGQKLGNKARELDLVAHNMGGKVGQANEIDHLRARWAALANERLRDAGQEARIDHRSHAERGIEAEPTKHLGPTATAIERRTGEPSAVRIRHEQEAAERLARAREAGELERQAAELDRSIIDVSGDLAAALAERDQLRAQQARQQAEKLVLPSMDAIRAARAASKAASQQAEEHQRIEHMTAAELRTEIERLRPPPVRELVDRDPAVVQAERLRDDLERRHTAAENAAEEARDAAAAWRERHKVQAWFHGREIGHAPVLRELEQQHDRASVECASLVRRIEPAILDVLGARDAAQLRITLEQAPIRAKLAELEAIEQAKRRQELEQERRQRAELDALRQEPRGRDQDQDRGLGW